MSRTYWVNTLNRIAHPVFRELSRGTFKESFPVYASEGRKQERAGYTHLEALGRSLAGIAPWLELDPAHLSGDELSAHEKLRELVLVSLDRAADPASADRMNFSEGDQPLVDAAFLAQGLLRSWNSVWLQLPGNVRSNIIRCMKQTRKIRPCFTNWLLFSAMVEAFLLQAGEDSDPVRIDYAVRQHIQWYKGDGAYGDGPFFHWDYYNSFVIQPMLFDIVSTADRHRNDWQMFTEELTARIIRYAAVQERLIAPDGSFPPLGRSLAYRSGAFHALALAAYKKLLPDALPPASVRCALTAVLKRTLDAPGTFDPNGWLRIGLAGNQPSLGEGYISTGSLYLCLCGFLPLGLAPEDPFWADPDAPWTSVRLWSGEDAVCDTALED